MRAVLSGTTEMLTVSIRFLICLWKGQYNFLGSGCWSHCKGSPNGAAETCVFTLSASYISFLTLHCRYFVLNNGCDSRFHQHQINRQRMKSTQRDPDRHGLLSALIVGIHHDVGCTKPNVLLQSSLFLNYTLRYICMFMCTLKVNRYIFNYLT